MWKAKWWERSLRSVRSLIGIAGRFLAIGCGALFWLECAAAQDAIELRVDFSRTNGTLRALHGINRGPLVAGGMINVTEAQRALQIPFTRLHDSHWPNSDVVDIHA